MDKKMSELFDELDVNKTINELWGYSRMYSERFGRILHIINENYFYEGLTQLLTFLESLMASYENDYEGNYSNLLRNRYSGEVLTYMKELKKFRNILIHKNLVCYSFRMIDGKVGYPLDEMSNYEEILYLIFSSILHIINNIDNETEITKLKSFVIDKFDVYQVGETFGYKKEDVEKFLTVGIENSMSINEKNRIRKANEASFVRRISGTSPICMWESILKQLLIDKV